MPSRKKSVAVSTAAVIIVAGRAATFSKERRMVRWWNALSRRWESLVNPVRGQCLVSYYKANDRKSPSPPVARPITVSALGLTGFGSSLQRVECELTRAQAQLLVDDLTRAIRETNTGGVASGNSAVQEAACSLQSREEFYGEFNQEPVASSKPAFDAMRVSLLLRAAAMANETDDDNQLAQRFLDFADEALTGHSIVISDLSESWESVRDSLPPHGEAVIVLNVTERRPGVAMLVPGKTDVWEFAAKRERPLSNPTHWLPFPRSRADGG